MTPQSNDLPERDAERESEPTVIRDKRRIDPETGELRQPAAESAAEEAPAPSAADAEGLSTADNDALAQAASALAEERLADLQRLQAEYVNYRKRVERDRNVARDSAIESVLETLLPVLDDIELARQHGDLADGPFAAIAEKLESALGKYGLTRYGSPGEEFDPNVHEALFHSTADDAEAITVTQVLQPGYKVGEKVLRPARVGVTGPE